MNNNYQVHTASSLKQKYHRLQSIPITLKPVLISSKPSTHIKSQAVTIEKSVQNISTLSISLRVNMDKPVEIKLNKSSKKSSPGGVKTVKKVIVTRNAKKVKQQPVEKKQKRCIAKTDSKVLPKKQKHKSQATEIEDIIFKLPFSSSRNRQSQRTIFLNTLRFSNSDKPRGAMSKSPMR